MIAQLLKEEKCNVPAKLIDVFSCLKFDRDLRTRLDAEGDEVDPRKQRSKARKKKGKAKVNAGEEDDAESALNADLKVRSLELARLKCCAPVTVLHTSACLSVNLLMFVVSECGLVSRLCLVAGLLTRIPGDYV